MKQLHIRRGRAVVEDVPAPDIDEGEVLVATRVSCVSVGTEGSGVRASAVPMWKRALKRPDMVAKTLKMAREKGIGHARQQVELKKNASTPAGYSAAGEVIAVGAGVRDFAPGDRIACAGGGYAQHAEVIRVPRNLCVKMPENVDWHSASTVALGAIALQGVRRAQPTLGEVIVVVGLGFLGQITAQLLRANGCRVIGIDLDEGRLNTAEALGMEISVKPSVQDQVDQVVRLTHGIGADGVIITAATSSDDVVSNAFRMTRRKGRVVLVGDVGLSLNRADFYADEIDFLISTSYGPGRYDTEYEEQGLDYPVGYVRWTENRNMFEYLRQISDGHIDLAPLMNHRFAIDEAETAYALLSADSKDKPQVVLLEYPDNDLPPQRSIRLRNVVATAPGLVRVALVGAGAFARGVHLPNIAALSDRFALQTIVARTGSSANAAAKQFGAVNASTDFEAVLEDPDVDAVIIATRHHLHADMALACLKAGKHVLVEKPLALAADELEQLDAYLNAPDGAALPVLLTGYNRRFSPYAVALARLLASRSGPFMLNYRMNAGHIPAEHWVHGPQGGGRNIGEACHIYDLIDFLADSQTISASAAGLQPAAPKSPAAENFVATLTLEDGSVASITYTALGAKDYPKEQLHIYFDGNVAVMEDYKSLIVHGPAATKFETAQQEKGHREELVAFAEAIHSGTWPITWAAQHNTARLALMIESELTHR